MELYVYTRREQIFIRPHFRTVANIRQSTACGFKLQAAVLRLFWSLKPHLCEVKVCISILWLYYSYKTAFFNILSRRVGTIRSFKFNFFLDEFPFLEERVCLVTHLIVFKNALKIHSFSYKHLSYIELKYKSQAIFVVKSKAWFQNSSYFQYNRRLKM